MFLVCGLAILSSLLGISSGVPVCSAPSLSNQQSPFVHGKRQEVLERMHICKDFYHSIVCVQGASGKT